MCSTGRIPTSAQTRSINGFAMLGLIWMRTMEFAWWNFGTPAFQRIQYAYVCMHMYSRNNAMVPIIFTVFNNTTNSSESIILFLAYFLIHVKMFWHYIKTCFSLARPGKCTSSLQLWTKAISSSYGTEARISAYTIGYDHKIFINQLQYDEKICYWFSIMCQSVE